MFTLDPRLASDTVAVTALSLCLVRLMNRRAWPWLVLVPRRPGAVEIIDLDPSDRSVLMEEIALCCAAIQRTHGPDKLNVGALGNLVPQLHVHVVGRRRDDPAWPGPVWGNAEARRYGPVEIDAVAKVLAAALSSASFT